jgi:hypothetical protein
MAGVGPPRVRSEVARQLILRRTAVRAIIRRQRLTQVVAEAHPAVGQQQPAALLQPPRGLRCPLAEAVAARVGDVFGDVVDVEDLVTAAEGPRRGFPDPFGAVAQDGDRGPVLDAQPRRPFAPMGAKSSIDSTAANAARIVGAGRWLLSQSAGVAGSPRPRRAKTPTFMSRQPPVVLTLAASVWNSASQAA